MIFVWWVWRCGHGELMIWWLDHDGVCLFWYHRECQMKLSSLFKISWKTFHEGKVMKLNYITGEKKNDDMIWWGWWWSVFADVTWNVKCSFPVLFLQNIMEAIFGEGRKVTKLDYVVRETWMKKQQIWSVRTDMYRIERGNGGVHICVMIYHRFKIHPVAINIWKLMNMNFLCYLFTIFVGMLQRGSNIWFGVFLLVSKFLR